MYAWIFRHLPGGLVLRMLLALVLIAAAVAALFFWVFPAVAPHVTFLTGVPAVE